MDIKSKDILKQALKASLDPDENADSREIAQQMRPKFQPHALDGLRDTNQVSMLEMMGFDIG